MQYERSKSLQLSKEFGKIVRELRVKRTSLSVNKFADSYDLSRGNLSKIENGEVECKFVTVWKVAEALNMKPSELIQIIEQKLGKNFKLMDE